MRRIILITALLLLSFPAVAKQTLSVQEVQETPQEEGRLYYTVDDLNYDCKKCVPEPKGSECIYCNGVLTGASTVLGMLEYNKTFCPPQTMDTRMVRNFFRKWVINKGKKEPEIMNMRAVKGLVMGMKETFPCKQNQVK